MCSDTDGATALGVRRDDCFCRKLPAVPDVGQSWIDRCGGLFSARCVEGELHQWNELVQWLIFRKSTGRVAAGQVEHAVLDRKAPVQRIGVACGHGHELPSLLVNPKVC